jgi:hypothetical protein
MAVGAPRPVSAPCNFPERSFAVHKRFPCLSQLEGYSSAAGQNSNARLLCRCGCCGASSTRSVLGAVEMSLTVRALDIHAG